MMDIRRFWKSELRKHGFKQGKGGRMVKDYGDTVGWAHIYQSRFSKWFLIDVGMIITGIPSGSYDSHLEARLDNVVPKEWHLSDILNLDQPIDQLFREKIVADSAKFLVERMDGQWSNKEWLIQQARLPYNPNVRILQSLVKYVAELDKSEET